MLNPHYLMLRRGVNAEEAVSITREALKFCRSRWLRAKIKILPQSRYADFRAMEDEAADQFIYTTGRCKVPKRDLIPMELVAEEVQERIVTDATNVFAIEAQIKKLKAAESALRAELRKLKFRRIRTVSINVDDDENAVESTTKKAKNRTRLPSNDGGETTGEGKKKQWQVLRDSASKT